VCHPIGNVIGVAASTAALLSRLGAATIENKQKLPIVPKRVEKAFKAPGKEPNDLQAASDGLRILDQVDPNKVFKVRWNDQDRKDAGVVRSDGRGNPEHSGPGIRTHRLGWDNGYLWVAETIDRAIYKLDPKDGRPPAKIQLTKEDPEITGWICGKGSSGIRMPRAGGCVSWCNSQAGGPAPLIDKIGTSRRTVCPLRRFFDA